MTKNFYRLTIGVFDTARFLSHGDEARVIERALRRADLKLVFTQGFSPRPVFSFGPARPTGFGSLTDFFEIGLDEDIPDELLKRKLNSKLPYGFFVFEARKIRESEFGKLNRLIKGSTPGVVINARADLNAVINLLNSRYGSHGRFIYSPENERLFIEKEDVAARNGKIYQKKRGWIVSFVPSEAGGAVFRLDKLFLGEGSDQEFLQLIEGIYILKYHQESEGAGQPLKK